MNGRKIPSCEVGKKYMEKCKEENRLAEKRLTVLALVLLAFFLLLWIYNIDKDMYYKENGSDYCGH